jgi:hypothetical protein
LPVALEDGLDLSGNRLDERGLHSICSPPRLRISRSGNRSTLPEFAPAKEHWGSDACGAAVVGIRCGAARGRRRPALTSALAPRSPHVRGHAREAEHPGNARRGDSAHRARCFSAWRQAAEPCRPRCHGSRWW